MKVTRSVLGAGTLLVPAALGSAPGSAPASLLLAAALCLWCLLLAGAGGTEEGPASFVARRLGPRAARAVQSLYFGGFAVGQAAVAAAAGEFAAGGGEARVLSFAVLAVAAVAATAGATLPRRAQGVRLAAVLVLVAFWWSGLLALPPSAPAPLYALLLPLLFAWVGLEGAVAGRGAARRTGRSGAVSVPLRTVGALVPAAALYAVLLAHTPPQGRGSAAVGWVAAALLTTYCLTNLRSAGDRWPAVSPGGDPRRGTALASVAALAVLVLAAATDADVAMLLIGPGAATAAIYTVLTVAAIRRTAPVPAPLPVPAPPPRPHGRRRTPPPLDRSPRTPSPVHPRPLVEGALMSVTETPTSAPVSKVGRVPAAAPADAAAHFYRRATFEADVADVHADIEAGANDFVLIDSRGQEAWDQGHIPGALHLPTDEIATRAADLVDSGALVVTYCWGPGCNGATRAAHAFATAGYSVKEMLGGFEYWSREGFPVEDATGTRRSAPDPLTAPTTDGAACGC